MESEVVVYRYLDYRKYLKDFYNQQKSKYSGYSYRVFANRAKLKSPNYLKLVIDGNRRITDRNMAQFLRGLKIKGADASYFKHLVQFNETADIEEKSQFLEKVLHLKSKGLTSSYELEEDATQVLKSWYNWVICELVNLKSFNNNPAWISRTLRNRITPKEAERSVDLLLRVGLLKEVDGKLVQTNSLISTSDEVASCLLRDLHKQFMEIGLNSLLFDPIDVREVSGLTIGLTQDQIPLFKQKIKEFRKDLNKTFTTEGGCDEIYHFESIFFPLTNKEKQK